MSQDTRYANIKSQAADQLDYRVLSLSSGTGTPSEPEPSVSGGDAAANHGL